MTESLRSQARALQQEATRINKAIPVQFRFMPEIKNTLSLIKQMSDLLVVMANQLERRDEMKKK